MRDGLRGCFGSGALVKGAVLAVAPPGRCLCSSRAKNDPTMASLLLQYIRENKRLSRLIEDARSRSSADAAQTRIDRADMTWTFRCEGEHLVTAAAVNHDMPSYGFCVEVASSPPLASCRYGAMV